VLYVGVVGYSGQKFDETDAREILEEALDDIEDEYVESGDFESITIVSGLTNMGIPKVAYEIADSRGYGTMGVAPEQANEYELYPVDEIIYEGENFGDESETFIDMLDVFVRVGGGAQAQHELELAEAEDISILEYDLESYSAE
ncbi:MAG: hypothetical protein KJO69_04715, partial [Gammaproteobacteria bacterium]|nr:hypothetical protein [Gammaproteobacteria bacterium]